MKRAVEQQLGQLKAKLGGYSALLVYRYANLCIEANPLALLAVEVEVEGEKKKIEEVAQVAEHETYHFVVSPNYEEDLFAIGKAVMLEHPEFKQEIKSFDGYDELDPAGMYLFYTMPEVDDDRHDALIKAVDAFYDECKVNMTKAEEDCAKKLVEIQADSSPMEIKKVADYIDQVVKYFHDTCDQSRDNKKQEVEQAYAEYQAKQKEKAAEEQEKQEAAGNPLQMKIEN